MSNAAIAEAKLSGLRDRLVDLAVEVDEVANRLHHAGLVDASRLVHVQASRLADCCRQIAGGVSTEYLSTFFPLKGALIERDNPD
jgi:hypothetical protein